MIISMGQVTMAISFGFMINKGAEIIDCKREPMTIDIKASKLDR